MINSLSRGIDSGKDFYNIRADKLRGKGPTCMLPVRCCCVPQKILGYLPAPYDFQIWDKFTYSQEKELPPLRVNDLPAYNKDYRTITLSIETWREGKTDEGGVAFKSDEIPLSEFKKIPGFISYSRIKAAEDA